ncbi:MAG: RNA-binding protein [Ruminiclostridium sp.]|nr:RNA-binding protein [Ruminiclostridium sp.]
MDLGRIVVSKAGRDAGRRFLVIKVVDEQFVQISDGDLRRVEKPKRKKVKHLEQTGEIAGTIEEKLKSNARITNSEVRKALAMHKGNSENGE